ncbi:IS630 family transposase [Streptomyces ipomoeae]|uniref:IS630 family transposase n=1 Tax=Streptomyces ipomoeae TaxID=103232 RepID=UPI00403C117D
MRYAQGGGLTAERRAFRERLRMDAAERFACGDDNAVIARDLRVSIRSVQRWHKDWSEGGLKALASKGPASLPLLSDELFAVLERELDKGPVAHGWPDQTWTLSRIKTLIGRRFHKSYTIQGVAALLKRHGWSCQVPARRAVERDEAAVRVGEGDLAAGGRTAAALGAWLVFEDEAGFSMTPPTTRTWSRRGRTPTVRVRGRSRRRLSVAALLCYKPGRSSRLIYRPSPDARPDGRKSFAWTDYRDLIQTAHQQLGGPIVLVWDNLNTHLTTGMRRYIAERDWLTVYQLPPYAPDLNPVEGIWSILRRTTLANRAFAAPQDLIAAVRRGLRQLQYRHDVLDGCLVGTGLIPAPP